MKVGYVSLIGRPNAGKSTLMNAIVGDKVAITSNKPQTTRTKILGVAHVDGGQIAFLDTPGIHKPVHRMNQRMVDDAIDAIREADVVVAVIDVTEKPGAGDHFVMDRLENLTQPVILALNKIDAIKKNELLPLIAGYSKAMHDEGRLRLPHRPSQRGQIDADERDRRRQGGDHVEQAADDADQNPGCRAC